MSIFEGRELWSSTCDAAENFEGNCLAIGPPNAFKQNGVLILMASPSGLLRAYLLHGEGHAVNDLILETNLGLPIVQIEFGWFGEDAENASIVILHPRKVVICTLQFDEFAARYNLLHLLPQKVHQLEEAGGESTSDISSLFTILFSKLSGHQRVFGGEHDLDVMHCLILSCSQCKFQHLTLRLAYGMIIDRFGSAATDCICVQSTEGKLSFFEGEVFFSVFSVDDAFLPGPVAYAQHDDLLLTCSSSFELRCYKFISISSQLHDEKFRRVSDCDVTARAKSIAPQHQWKLCVGEPVLRILPVANQHTCSGPRKPPQINQNVEITPHRDIVVLAEKSLFVVTNTGVLKIQKRLDFAPITCHVLRLLHEDAVDHFGLLVADSTGSIMVFRGSQLLWTSKLQVKPVDLMVTYFQDTFGHIIALGRDGVLSISCLGTVPHDTLIRGSERQESSFLDIDQEYRELSNELLERSSDAYAVPSQQVEIAVRFQDDVVREASELSETHVDSFMIGSNMLTLQISVLYNGTGTLDDVGVQIAVPHPIIAARSNFLIPSLCGGTPEIVYIHLSPRGLRSHACIPSSNIASIVASYCTPTIESGISTREVHLPLSFFCAVASPVKTARHKVTIEINRSPPCLTVLFKDMITSQKDDKLTSSGNVLGFEYHNGVNVTLVASKSTGRFRIQSSNLTAVWLLLSEFTCRLWEYFKVETSGSTVNSPFRISLHEPLPLQNLFEAIEENYSARLGYDGDNIKLASFAHSFRAVQKKLLFWFKNKYPVSVAHLDDLLDVLVSPLDAVCEDIHEYEKGLLLARQRLVAAVELLMSLVQHRLGMDSNKLRILRCYIPTVAPISVDNGWDDWTEAAISILLSTRLAKNGKNKTKHNLFVQSKAEPSTVAGDRKNMSKIKKNVLAVFERLGKGSF